MDKKKFVFRYDLADAVFLVDLELFTPEMAKETLTFFYWDYDHEEDPVVEVLKKYALRVFLVGFGTGHKEVVRKWDEEGFAPIDGSLGVELVDFSDYQFLEDNLEMEVYDV